MNTLQTSGPTEVNLNKAKETMIRDYETNAEQNNYWLNKIKGSLYNESELLTIEQIQQMINNVTTDDIKKAAGKYFNSNHYLRVVLRPEEK